MWTFSCVDIMLCFILTLSSGVTVTASPVHSNVHTWILFSSHLTYSFMREVCFCSHQGFLKDEAAFISYKIFSSGSHRTTWHHILQDSSVHSCCNETPKSHILNLCSCSSQVIFCSLWCLTLCAFFGAICYWHLGRNKWTTYKIWCSVSTFLTFCSETGNWGQFMNVLNFDLLPHFCITVSVVTHCAVSFMPKVHKSYILTVCH